MASQPLLNRLPQRVVLLVLSLVVPQGLLGVLVFLVLPLQSGVLFENVVQHRFALVV